jgi:outer membrane protein assembly factor BamB
VFAYDLRTGRLAWRYGGDVIRNATLAVSSGRVFLVEHRGQKKPPRILTALEKAKADAARRKGLVAAPPERPSDGEPEPAPPRATNGMVRTVVALDLLTGREVWARDVDLTACGSWTGGLCLMVKDGVVILCGVYTAYGKPPPDVAQRRAMALSAADGSTLWNEPLGNLVRPVLVKDRLITRPRAFDLKTGRPLTRTVAGRTTPWRIMPLGACGQMSASAHSLFYRYGNTMMMDADTGSALMSFVGMRPGCLINIIPAGGVVVQVEASSGCTCGHAIQSTIAFAPAGAE